MYGEIYVKSPNSINLNNFSKEIFNLLNTNNYEERDSSNYIEETYFVSKINGLKITIYYNDDNIDNCKFGLHIDTLYYYDQAPGLINHLTDYIARILFINNYEIIIPESPFENTKYYTYKNKKKKNNSIDTLDLIEIIIK